MTAVTAWGSSAASRKNLELKSIGAELELFIFWTRYSCIESAANGEGERLLETSGIVESAANGERERLLETSGILNLE